MPSISELLLPIACAHPPFEGRYASRARTRTRALRLETLESRYALSLASAINLDPCSATSSTDAPQESAALIEETPVEVASTEDDVAFVGPLDVDSYYAVLDAAAPASPTIAPEGEANDAPVLISFTGNGSGLFWTFEGQVADDINPANCRVYFGGLLLGHSTAVMSDGSFHYFTMLPPGTTGLVTAVAKDSDGNFSNWLGLEIGL